MTTLDDLRAEIDRIDRTLVPLLVERMACSAAVAQYKRAQGLPVYDAQREELLLARIAQQAGPDAAHDVARIYDTILACSRDVQHRLLDADDTRTTSSEKE